MSIYIYIYRYLDRLEKDEVARYVTSHPWLASGTPELVGPTSFTS